MSKERTPTGTIAEEIEKYIITRLLKEPAMDATAARGAALLAITAMARGLDSHGQYTCFPKEKI